MNINILRYSHFGIAGGQEVDHTFVKFIIYPLTMIAWLVYCSVCFVRLVLTRNTRRTTIALLINLVVC